MSLTGQKSGSPSGNPHFCSAHRAKNSEYGERNTLPCAPCSVLSFHILHLAVENVTTQGHPVEIHPRGLVGRLEIGSIVDAGFHLAVEDRLHQASSDIVKVNDRFRIDL
jgi:hypothetical protein